MANGGPVLEHKVAGLKAGKKTAHVAVKKGGLALKFASARLQAGKRVARAAVRLGLDVTRRPALLPRKSVHRQKVPEHQIGGKSANGLFVGQGGLLWLDFF